MRVEGFSSTGSSAGTAGSEAGVLPSGTLRQDFMKLLITQLQHQDPLQPLQDRELMAQLAQLASVESLQHIEAMTQQGQVASQLSQAAALIGRTVSGLSGDGVVTGKVTGAAVGADSQVYLAVGDAAVALGNVLQVAE